MNNQPSNHLKAGKRYHFNVVYHSAKSKLSRNSDTDLSKAVTEHFIQKARSWGYDKAFYEGRDALPGTNIFTQLFDVITTSLYTVVFITEGFLEDCWNKYCQMAAFKTLLDDPNATTSKLILVLVGVSDTQIPNNLCLNHVVSFTKTDWLSDDAEWRKVRQIMDDPSIILGETQPAIKLHHSVCMAKNCIYVQDTCPPLTEKMNSGTRTDCSLSQFNMTPQEAQHPVTVRSSPNNSNCGSLISNSHYVDMRTPNCPNGRVYNPSLELKSDSMQSNRDGGIIPKPSPVTNRIQNGVKDQDFDVDQPTSSLSNDSSKYEENGLASSLTAKSSINFQRPSFNKATAFRAFNLLQKCLRLTSPEQGYN